jgi:hypothetical protein
MIYRRNDFSRWIYPMLLEWHAIAVLVLSLGLIRPHLMYGALAMWGVTLFAALRATTRAPLSKNAPRWSRPLVFGLYLLQPLIRAGYRYRHRVVDKRLPVVSDDHSRDLADRHVKRLGWARYDLYWTSNRNLGRAEFLHSLEELAAQHKWYGDFRCEWDEKDVDLIGDRWYDIGIRTATEELGWPRRFTRVRCTLHPTMLAWCIVGSALLLTAETTIRWGVVAAAGAAVGWGVLLGRVLLSRRSCRRAVSSLVWKAGLAAGLEPVAIQVEKAQLKHSGDLPIVTTL